MWSFGVGIRFAGKRQEGLAGDTIPGRQINNLFSLLISAKMVKYYDNRVIRRYRLLVLARGSLYQP